MRAAAKLTRANGRDIPPCLTMLTTIHQQVAPCNATTCTTPEAAAASGDGARASAKNQGTQATQATACQSSGGSATAAASPETRAATDCRSRRV